MYLFKVATHIRSGIRTTAKTNPFLIAVAILFSFPLIANADPGHTGPPIAYGQWNATLSAGKSVVNDTSLECASAGWTCKTIAEDDGFLYQEVRTADGETYTRMINLDPGSVGDASTLGFSTEAYTARQERDNNNDFTFADDDSLAVVAQGLASRQIIRDGALDTTVELQNGFARGLLATNSGFSTPADPIRTWCIADNGGIDDAASDACAVELAQKGWNVKITQAIHDTDLDSDFSILNYYELPLSFGSAVQTSVLRGQIMDIAQTVTDLPSGDQSKFDIRKREGRSGYEWWCNIWSSPCNPLYDLTTGGSITLAGNTQDTISPTSTTWAAQDFVRATWIGSTMGSGAGFMLTTANDVNTNGAGSGEAREVFVNVVPTSSAGWNPTSDPFYDLNWPVATANIPDPFTGITHTAAPSARTATPTF